VKRGRGKEKKKKKKSVGKRNEDKPKLHVEQGNNKERTPCPSIVGNPATKKRKKKVPSPRPKSGLNFSIAGQDSQDEKKKTASSWKRTLKG